MTTEKRENAFPMAELLETMKAIRELLDRMQGTTVSSDFVDHIVQKLPAGTTGTIRLKTHTPFTSVVIPETPRDLTKVYVGNEKRWPIRSVTSGKTLNIVCPEADELSIEYAAGSGTIDYLDIYFSVRPFSVSVY